VTAAATASPPVRHVEQVMGMPISVALRGRHADDVRGRAAWLSTLAVLREADRVFSTYRADSVVSRLGRGELDLDRCPPRSPRFSRPAGAAPTP
jgi:FAD:protein FMN transferase